jgi:ceramide glucosyltransferase
VIFFSIVCAYQVFAILACLWRGRSRQAEAGKDISILKPVSGAGGNLREALASHAKLDCELLCGVASPDDPAVAIICEFPKARLVVCSTTAPNAKVGILIDLVKAARYDTIIVNDSDICVEPDYLSRVTSPLSDAKVGLVTCLYRAVGDTFPARFEALGVATDFAPSTRVARFVGVDEFAMGSTLAFRRADLERIGGFESIADCLADDYQLGHRLHSLGLKCVLSDAVVETHLGGGWIDVWRHQIRWARTIRVSKFYGYLGLPVTFATLWAMVAAACGRWQLAIVILLIRLTMAVVGGWFVIRSKDALRLFPLIPLRDLFGVVVWIVALFGNTVIWRGRKLRIDRDGRII